MEKNNRKSAVAALLAIMFSVGITVCLRAQTALPAALAGRVSSSEEGPMEGVLVSAKRAGSTISVTVASDAQGRYTFPRNRLEPGDYTVRMRAVGYDLDDPGTVQITANKTTAVELKLHKTKDLASQLTSAEWLQSFPGTQEQKTFLLGCTTCHTLERIAKSNHNADEWMSVFQRMTTYYPEDTPYRPQKRVYPSAGFGPPDKLRKQAEWMATINLSSSDTWNYPLRTLPRLKGRATHVIITEYDLPRKDSVPHDLLVDSKGMIWYDDAGWQFLGKLDPKTGKVEEYPAPTFIADYPVGMLDLQMDKEGNLWPAMMDQGKLAKFDTKTLKFTFWDLPKEPDLNVQQINFLMPYYSSVDGKVWTSDSNILELRRLDIHSGKIDLYKVFDQVPGGAEGHAFYDVAADSQNNGYVMDIGGGNIVRVNAKSGKVTLFPTPTPNSGPRRGQMDPQDRLWFGEYRGNRVGMFDAREEKFQEWEAPNPWTAPYGAALDKNGEVWVNGITTDRVQRLDPKTGKFTEYPLPRYSSIRRVGLDNSTTPVTFWTPNKNSASIIRVEPLD